MPKPKLGGGRIRKRGKVLVLRYATPDTVPSSLRTVALNVADDMCEANDIPDTVGECVVSPEDIAFYYDPLAPIGEKLVSWLKKNNCDLAFRY